LVNDLEDPRRTEPAYVADERTMLEAWLEFHRMTLLLKCEGVDRAGLIARPVATSLLSLHGLVRHMADVERNWFTRVLFHLLVHRELERLNEAALDIAERTSTFIGHFAATEVPGVQTTELTVGAASFQVAVDEARELYGELLGASA